MKAQAVLMTVLLLVSPALAAAESDGEMAAMLELADNSRCLICHDVDSNVTGPAWRDVAKRYRDGSDGRAIEEILVKRVYEGSSGNWGTETMSSNKRAGIDNIRVLVRWILTLR